MTQFLALIFSRIRQPRVIAEVIGGVLLGPTVMGRIPGFKNAIFPGSCDFETNLTPIQFSFYSRSRHAPA